MSFIDELEAAKTAKRERIQEQTQKQKEFVTEFERRGHLLDVAWGIIANASNGNWNEQNEDWQQAAARWRDDWLGNKGTDVSSP